MWGKTLTVALDDETHDFVRATTHRPLVATLPDGSTVALPAGTVLRDGMTWEGGPPADPLRDLLTALRTHPDPALATMIGKLVTQIETGSIPLLSQARALLQRARPWIAPSVPDVVNAAAEAQPANTIGQLRAEIDALLAGLPVTAGRVWTEEQIRAAFVRAKSPRTWEHMRLALDARCDERGRAFEPTADETAAYPVLAEVAGKPTREAVLFLAQRVFAAELRAPRQPPDIGRLRRAVSEGARILRDHGWHASAVELQEAFEVVCGVPTPAPGAVLLAAAEAFMRDAFARGIKGRDAAKEIGRIIETALDRILPPQPAKPH